MPFTDEQQAVIAHPGGHARIVAVAGSGKTSTLTAYLGRRLNAGANPRRLLVLMYNKAAQQDVARRLAAQHPNLTLPEVRTFHSLGYRILQRLVHDGDVRPVNWDLLSDAQVEPVVWRLLRAAAEDEEQAEDILSRKKKWVEPALNYFELVKSSLASPAEVFEQSGLPKACRLFIEVFEQFEQWRADQRRLTFADLLYDPVRCLIAKPDVAARFAGHMDEILVDEYQDINPIQQRLLEILHGGRGQVMVVGDPDQTIYEFRGSEPSLLTDAFQRHFPEPRDYQLSWTFRYGHQLSLLANQLIQAGADRVAASTLCLSHVSTPRTRVRQMRSDDSAQAALDCIQAWQRERPLTDIAVLNRLWANSARLELKLLAANLPYRLESHRTVLERFELAPFWVLLDLASGDFSRYSDEQRRHAWRTLLTQPYLKIRKAIVDELLAKLAGVASDTARHFRNALPDNLAGFQADQLLERARLMQKAEASQSSATELVSGWLIGTDYLNALRDNAFSAQQVDDQVATVTAFVDFIAAQRWSAAEAADQLRALQAQRRAGGQNGVTLTSIHKAKGREWPCVLIPELNARFYPYHPEGDLSRPANEDSERRLLYVALTRARDEAVLLTPLNRQDTPDSPFWRDLSWDGCRLLADALDAGVTEVTLPDSMNADVVSRYLAAQGRQLTVHWERTTPTNSTALGRRLRHPKFGAGQLLSDDGDRLQIRFLRDGQARQFDRRQTWPLLEWLDD
ncbi:ATP-dependent helicase [Saccharospirillum mangrovi]|uniref:ATP-dependent helicase n=1 Tax=Saccharospirillum mangrovi TaxID=2161747 RepID=UPI000D3A1147|nr:ATP-dependent helicase [Saccharospirillum mangrovi]